MTAVSPGDLLIPGPFTHELVHTRGTRLHAAVAGQEDAPLVIFLHDALGGWFDFRHLLEPLASDYHVAALSRRGFAASDKPPTGYSLRHAVGDLSGSIRALGHGSATVVATGDAARVATALAANYPERVRNLVLITPTARPAALLQARLASHFSERIAQATIPDRIPDQERTKALRALSYRLPGTHRPRIRATWLAWVPAPIKWTMKPPCPVVELDFPASTEEVAPALRPLT